MSSSRRAKSARSGTSTASFGFAFDGEPSHRLLDPDQAGGAILDLGVYPVHLTNLFLGEPDRGAGRGQPRANGRRRPRRGDADLSRRPHSGPPPPPSVVCSLVTDLPVRLEVFGERGSLSYDDAILPAEFEVVLER